MRRLVPTLIPKTLPGSQMPAGAQLLDLNVILDRLYVLGTGLTDGGNSGDRWRLIYMSGRGANGVIITTSPVQDHSFAQSCYS